MKKYILYGSHAYALPILQPIYHAIKARGDDACWMVDAKELHVRVQSIEPGSKIITTAQEAVKYKPDAVFSASNLVPYFVSGVKVQLFHGFHARKRSDNKGHFRIRGFFDLYCTQGPDTTAPFKELERKLGYFRVVETGWSKVDPLFTSKKQRAETAKPIILLTSTFTERLSAAEPLFPYVKRLVEQGNWRWVSCFHPKLSKDTVAKYKTLEGDCFLMAPADRLVELIADANVMVSDTSSAVSEFLVARKPVVTFRNRVPGDQLLNFTDPTQLEKMIQAGLSPSEELNANIDRYARNIHPYTDGKSSDRVLDAVARYIQEGASGLKKKPLNLYRKYKIRKKFNYFQF